LVWSAAAAPVVRCRMSVPVAVVGPLPRLPPVPNVASRVVVASLLVVFVLPVSGRVTFRRGRVLLFSMPSVPLHPCKARPEGAGSTVSCPRPVIAFPAGPAPTIFIGAAVAPA